MAGEGRREEGGVRAKRGRLEYGPVTVRSPGPSQREKWTLDMVHSGLSLYWQGRPDRAREELYAIVDGLRHIARATISEQLTIRIDEGYD
jgi:hypothetical protein